MKDRNSRDAARRQYIKQRTEENLRAVLDDPNSLFAGSDEIQEIHK
jgi:hypothetical protein